MRAHDARIDLVSGLPPLPVLLRERNDSTASVAVTGTITHSDTMLYSQAKALVPAASRNNDYRRKLNL